jgi:hypothetical protein
MMRSLWKIILPITTLKGLTEKTIVYLSRFTHVNLLKLAFQEMGILKYENFVVSGEKNWIHHELKNWVKNTEPLFLDVGANLGLYSLELREAFPKSKIISFEPNPVTYELLKKEISGRRMEVENLGMGSKEEVLKIYTYRNDLHSGHASIYKNMFTDRRHHHAFS